MTDFTQNSNPTRLAFATALCKPTEVANKAQAMAVEFRQNNPGLDIVSVQHSTAYIPEAQLIFLSLVIQGAPA